MTSNRIMAIQKIIPIRRDYNRWVANQTLEDYALRFTAHSARRWSNFRVANTALGAISFLALEAIGGAITLNYGFTNAMWAIVSVSLLIFLTGLPISYYAAKHGLDMDLLTRGAGFGYLGSTITSLIYASFTFIFFAIEAAIMAHALKLCLGVPLTIGYIVSAIVVIPLVTHGITLISRFQTWTQPLWIALHLLPFVFIAMQSPESFAQWTYFTGDHGDVSGGFNLLQYGAAAAVVMSLVVQIGEQVDFLRFLPRPTPQTRFGWWVALVSAGPGWIIPGALKLLAGSFLAFLALQHNVPADQAAEPTQMYLTGFNYVFSSPNLALAATGLFVVVSQLKINVTNAYAGSIAWSNFFARMTQNHPGRVVWVVFNVVIAFLLTELGIFKALETILGLYANLAIAWIGALVADLVINKPLGLSPPSIEFKRAHLYDINPVGIGAMAFAAIISIAAYTGFLGEVCKALSAFIAFGVAFATAPLIAKLTHGKYYLARKPKTEWQGSGLQRCCVCEHSFELQDVAHCPAYGGTICSLCCSLDARCNDICKDKAQLRDQIIDFLGSWLPQRTIALLDSRLGRYLSRFVLAIGLIATVIGLVYFQETLNGETHYLHLQTPLLKVFLFLTLIAGVTSWLFVLAQESRLVAREESLRQNQLLRQEVEAHQQTDAALKRAKEVAEAANLAKSRYLSGISHELRTPLNAILGYAQLLEHENPHETTAAVSVPPTRRRGLKVIKRSGEHLSVLIDGLLDMAKIEAGRLVLRRDSLALAEFIEQLVQMFELQAEAKGLVLRLDIDTPLPPLVLTDEKRLRQILINLLSNAIKYTDKGSVVLRVSFRRQIAEFEVRDTGIGIETAELKRIFEPFERGASSAGIAGTGLGLTISDLLAQVMGGDITVTSVPGSGSVFRLRILLTVDQNEMALPRTETRISGYLGQRRKILVVDDDADHRMLMRDALAPLGFTLFTASDGAQCLQFLPQCAPDLLLLDISMPGMDGWEVIKRIRTMGFSSLPVIIVSASIMENQHPRDEISGNYDFLAKPVAISQLLDLLQKHLALEWSFAACEQLMPRTEKISGLPIYRLEEAHVEELIALGKIGYVRGIESKLASLQRISPESGPLLDKLEDYVRTFQFKPYLNTLEALLQSDKQLP
jgi:signal transduction histidine kinase/purine-cytosine permease-like protein/ActR/RegA family two-component response regulator